MTSAREHVRKRWVLSLDLKDFFPSITSARVYGLLRSPFADLPDGVNAIATRLCTLDGALPIGAPTSPIISNAVCYQLDGHLMRFAKQHRLRYTRYADDITFSGYQPTFPTAAAVKRPDGATVGDELEEIIRANGFAVNPAKVHLAEARESQRVTGLTVNKKTNVDRRFIRNLRAMMHNIEVQGWRSNQQRYIASLAGSRRPGEAAPDIKDAIRGRIEYVGMVRGHEDRIYRDLLHTYEVLTGAEEPDRSNAVSVSILHLSDFHLRASRKQEWQPRLRGLLSALADVSPDLIVVTGDIAYSGQADEYDLAYDWFIKQLLPALGLDRDRLFLVPGNHDVNRSLVSPLVKQIRRTTGIGRDDLLTECLQSHPEHELLLNPFTAYLDFVERMGRQRKLWYGEQVEVRGSRISIAGVNSALLSFDNADETQLLTIGAIQYAEACLGTGADLKIAAFHHPPAFLDDRSRAQRDVANWADIVLTGHVHEEQAAAVSSVSSETFVVSGGASYQDDGLRNAVQLLTYVPDERKLHVRTWEWNHHRVWREQVSHAIQLPTVSTG